MTFAARHVLPSWQRFFCQGVTIARATKLSGAIPDKSLAGPFHMSAVPAAAQAAPNLHARSRILHSQYLQYFNGMVACIMQMSSNLT